MAESLDPRFARAYRRRARLSRSLGLAAVIVAGAGLLNADALTHTAAGLALGAVTYVWLAGYFAGGVASVVGYYWRPFPNPVLEVLGLWLLLGAMIVNGIAIVAVRGPVAGGLTSAGLFAIADVLYGRIRDLEDARVASRRRTEERGD